MNAPRRHESAGRPVVPWRNGAGLTAPVAVGMDSGDELPVWRVSIATIEGSGPFSEFTGLDRHFLLLDGEGLILEIGDRRQQHLARHDVVEFAGEEIVAVRDVRDVCAGLNLMVDRSRGRGRLSVVPVDGTVPVSTRAGEAVVVVALTDGVSLLGDERLMPHDAVELSAGTTCTLTGVGVVAIARIIRTA